MMDKRGETVTIPGRLRNPTLRIQTNMIKNSVHLYLITKYYRILQYSSLVSSVSLVSTKFKQFTLYSSFQKTYLSIYIK